MVGGCFKALAATATSSLLFQLFELLLTVATLYYGGVLVLDGVMSGGHLVAFILYQAQLGSCIEVGQFK